MPQVRHVALLAEPISKASDRKRLAQFSDQERQVTAWRRVNNRAQVWMDWNFEFEAGGAFCFLPGPEQRFVFHMLRTHCDHILPRLASEEPQRHRQPALRTNWVPPLELSDLGFRPPMKSSL